MSKEAPSFSKYGKDFQETLCQMILQDRPFADQIMEVLDIRVALSSSICKEDF